MKYALWILQVLVGLAFMAAGFLKLTSSGADLVAQGMAWAAAVPAWLIPVIGASELAGGLGLILPAATRIQPQLTPLAAALLAVVMVLAFITHLVLGDPAESLISPVVLGGLSAFIAYGRYKILPIEPKSA